MHTGELKSIPVGVCFFSGSANDILTNWHSLRDVPQALLLLTCFFFSSFQTSVDKWCVLNATGGVASFPTFLFPIRTPISQRNPVHHTGTCLEWLPEDPAQTGPGLLLMYYFTYCQWLIQTCSCDLTLAYEMHSEISWVTFGEVSYLLSGNHKNEGVLFCYLLFSLWVLFSLSIMGRMNITAILQAILLIKGQSYYWK